MKLTITLSAQPDLDLCRPQIVCNYAPTSIDRGHIYFFPSLFNCLSVNPFVR